VAPSRFLPIYLSPSKKLFVSPTIIDCFLLFTGWCPSPLLVSFLPSPNLTYSCSSLTTIRNELRVAFGVMTADPLTIGPFFLLRWFQFPFFPFLAHTSFSPPPRLYFYDLPQVFVSFNNSTFFPATPFGEAFLSPHFHEKSFLLSAQTFIIFYLRNIFFPLPPLYR